MRRNSQPLSDGKVTPWASAEPEGADTNGARSTRALGTDIGRYFNRVRAVLVGGVQHRLNVFWRDVGLDIVNLVENVAAPGSQNAESLLDVLP